MRRRRVRVQFCSNLVALPLCSRRVGRCPDCGGRPAIDEDDDEVIKCKGHWNEEQVSDNECEKRSDESICCGSLGSSTMRQYFISVHPHHPYSNSLTPIFALVAGDEDQLLQLLAEG